FRSDPRPTRALEDVCDPIPPVEAPLANLGRRDEKNGFAVVLLENGQGALVPIEVAVVERDGDRIRRQRRAHREGAKLVDADDIEVIFEANDLAFELFVGDVDDPLVEGLSAVAAREPVLRQNTVPRG